MGGVRFLVCDIRFSFSESGFLTFDFRFLTSNFGFFVSDFLTLASSLPASIAQPSRFLFLSRFRFRFPSRHLAIPRLSPAPPRLTADPAATPRPTRWPLGADGGQGSGPYLVACLSGHTHDRPPGDRFPIQIPVPIPVPIPLPLSFRDTAPPTTGRPQQTTSQRNDTLYNK